MPLTSPRNHTVCGERGQRAIRHTRNELCFEVQCEGEPYRSNPYWMIQQMAQAKEWRVIADKDDSLIAAHRLTRPFTILHFTMTPATAHQHDYGHLASNSTS